MANKFTIWINSVADTKAITAVSEKLGAVRDRLASMAKGALVAGIGAVTAAVWQLTGSLKAFARQELSEFDMESALKQMGQYTDQYRDKLVRLSQQYQQTTNIGDEMWLKTFGQLTRFGMTSENVDRVAEATKNLAALMDGNLQGAALAMQRALEGSFDMFSRYGIKLELTGDKVKDLDNLMALLAQKGGGLLEARAQTLSGKWEALKNAMSDFREEVGRTITESSGLKDGLDWLASKFKELEESAKNGKLHKILKEAGEAVRNWGKEIADIVDQIRSVDDIKVIAEVLGDWLKEKLIEAGQRIAAFLLEKAPSIGDAIGSAVKNSLLGFFKGQIREGTAEQMASQSMYGKDSPGLFSKAGWGLDSDYNEKVRFYEKALKADELQQAGRAAAAQIEISQTSQTSLADRIRDALAVREAEQPSGLIRVQIPDGEFIGDAKGLQEFIDNLRQTDAALADMVQQAADTNGGAQKAVESANKVQEETSKTLKTVGDSHRALESTLRSTQTASQTTTQVAQQTQQVVDVAIGQMAAMSARIQQQQAALNAIAMQLRSMRA